MPRIPGAILGAALALVPGMAQAEARRVLEPASPWAMEYAEDSCRLIREFSDAKGTVTLAIQRDAPGTGQVIGVVGDDLRVDRKATSATVTFAPEGSNGTNWLFQSRLEDGSTSYLLLGTPLPATPGSAPRAAGADAIPVTFAQERAEQLAVGESTTAIVLGDAFWGGLRFETGTLDKPLAAMHRCEDDLMVSRGMDPAVQLSLSRRASVTNEMALLRALFGAVGRSVATVRASLVVSPNGAVEQCRILYPRWSEDEEKEMCETIGRFGKYTPALDASGEPVRSYIGHEFTRMTRASY